MRPSVGLGLRRVGRGELDVEDLALADAADAAEAERGEGAFDGLALRVEDAVFSVTVTRAFTEPTLAPYWTEPGRCPWAARCSIRMPSRRATSW